MDWFWAFSECVFSCSFSSSRESHCRVPRSGGGPAAKSLPRGAAARPYSQLTKTHAKKHAKNTIFYTIFEQRKVMKRSPGKTSLRADFRPKNIKKHDTRHSPTVQSQKWVIKQWFLKKRFSFWKTCIVLKNVSRFEKRASFWKTCLVLTHVYTCIYKV